MAVDCNPQGRAYLLHARVGEAPESFDQHAHSNTLDRIEIDHRPPRHGIVSGLQEHFTRQAPDRRGARGDQGASHSRDGHVAG